MKLFVIIIQVLLFTACTSTPFERQLKQQQLINEHLAQGKTYIKGDFSPKYKNSSNDGMYMKAIGISIMSASSNETLVRAAAISNGKFKLIDSAPTHFKSKVQAAIGTMYGYAGDFNKIQTSVLEVHKLRGIEVNESDVDCRMTSEPTVEGGYRTNKECRAIVRVPVLELNKAFSFSVKGKFKDVNKKEVMNKIRSTASK